MSHREGEVLLEKYTIENEVGRGGMGYVVAARHRELDELVAIKLILSEYAENEAVVRRFMREARAAAKIASEHVVRVMDVGRLPTGEPYMVMEFLRGQDLEQLLDTRGTLSIAETVDYVMQALEAVAEAHAVGIVHRDLKPANLFVSPRRSGVPCVKVLDFGISKLISAAATASSMAKTQGVLGSPLYMSPEQLRSSGDVDHRTDIWAIGVILFQLMSGRLPFVADSLPQLVVEVLGSEPTGLRAHRPEVPVALADVVLRCLAKDADARYASVTDLARALAPFGTEGALTSLRAVENALPSGSLPLGEPLPSSPDIAVPASSEIAPASSSDRSAGSKGAAALGYTLQPVDTRVPAESAPNRKKAAMAFGLLALALVAGVTIILGGKMSAAKDNGLSTRSGLVGGSASFGTSAVEPARSAPRLAPEAPARADVSARVVAVTATEPASRALTRLEATKPAAQGAQLPAAGGKGLVTVRPTATSAPPTPAVVNCQPPYTVGAGGAHIPKPECL